MITGGVRSGKSRHAESLLAEAVSVTYVAPGPTPDAVTDPEWAERVRLHRQRRPSHWRTVESADLAGAIPATGPVLIDCLGTWVTAVMDELDGWTADEVTWRSRFDERLDGFVEAWSAAEGPLVAVTNEVGMGVVPEHRSGRVFRDLLGTVNQRVAAASDDVLLVIAGRVLIL